MIPSIFNNKIENPSFSALVKIKPSSRFRRNADHYLKTLNSTSRPSTKREPSWIDAGIKEGAIASGVIIVLGILASFL